MVEPTLRTGCLQEMFIYQTPAGDFYSGQILQPGEVEKVGTHHKCVLGIKCSDLSLINTVEPRKILASIGTLILEKRNRK